MESREYAKAEAKVRAVLAGLLPMHEDESSRAAEALDILLEAAWRGRLAGADLVSLGEKAIAIKEQLLGPNDPSLFISLKNLGNLYNRRNQAAEARPYYEKALANLKTNDQEETIEAAQILNNLGNVAADYVLAREYHERSLAIRQKLRPPDHPDIATSLNSLGGIAYDLGEYAEAETLYRRALEIREKTLDPKDPFLVSTLEGLGNVLSTAGRYEEAAAYHRKVCSLREASVGVEDPDYAAALTNLSVDLLEMGDTTAARDLLDRALRILRVRPQPFILGLALNNYGRTLYRLGDLTEAEKALHEAIETRRAVLPPGHLQIAETLLNLAYLRSARGSLAEARTLYAEALEIQKGKLGPKHPTVGGTLNDLATVLVADGDFEGADRLYREAEEIARATYGPEHPDLARILSNRAQAALLVGEYGRAQEKVESAVQLREKFLGPTHPSTAISMGILAGALARTGGPANAMEVALRSEELVRQHATLMVPTLPERQALAHVASRPSSLPLALSLALSYTDPSMVRGGWDSLIRSRGLVLDEMLSRRKALVGVDEAVKPLLEEYITARTELANLTVRNPTGRDPNAYRERLDTARVRKEAAERALAQKSLPLRKDLARKAVGLAEIARALPEDSALLAFVLFPRESLPGRSPGKTSIRPPPPKEPIPTYAAFVLSAGGADPQMVEIGLATTVDDAVARWRRETAGAAAVWRLPAESEARSRKAGQVLRRLVWDPIAPRLSRAKRVFVVPDGSLHFVNLSALPEGTKAYLVEKGPLLHHLSTERDLLSGASGPAGARGVLVVGSPAYADTSLFAAMLTTGESRAAPPLADAGAATSGSAGPVLRSNCADFRAMRFESLPRTEEEAKNVAALFGPEDGERTILLGSAASEGAFKRLAPGRRILHLATHGFFLAGSCTSMPLEGTRGIGGIASLAAPEAAPPPAGENPLLLSGLALAGANHRDAAGPGEEDGILTAEEIAGLDLSGVEWAVLSACDTGVGEVRTGEGVFGLRRALQLAGAATVVMSLWSVEDESARAWMKALYESRFGTGLSTAEAVREASVTLLRQRREAGLGTHPFFWGGFVAAGDWR